MAAMKDLTSVPLQILLVDDDEQMLAVRERALRKLCPAWTVSAARSGEQALRILEQRGVDVVITDVIMQGMRGTELLRITKQIHPRIVRIVLSGILIHDVLVETAKWSEHTLCKPCTPAQLCAAITEAVAKKFSQPPGYEQE